MCGSSFYISLLFPESGNMADTTRPEAGLTSTTSFLQPLIQTQTSDVIMELNTLAAAGTQQKITSPAVFESSTTTDAQSMSSTGSPTAGVSRYDMEYAARIHHFKLFLYAGMLLLLLGLIGNFMSFCVLQTARFRPLSSSFLLSALAVVDSGFLLTALLWQWVLAYSRDTYDIRVSGNSLAGCRAHYFFKHYFFQMSAWTLLLVTAERLVSVVRPLQARIICSRKRVIITWCVMAVVLFLLNAHMFTTVKNTVDPRKSGNGGVEWFVSCGKDKHSYPELWRAWGWVDKSVAVFVPGVALLVINIIIIMKVREAKRDRRISVRSQKTSKEAKSTRHVTAMLIGISMLFLATNLPMAIYGIGDGNWPWDTPAQVYNTNVAYSAVEFIMYLNFSLNFLLYCVCGRSMFRQALLELLGCRSARKRRKSSSRYTASTSGNMHTVSFNRSMSTVSFSRSVSVSQQISMPGDKLCSIATCDTVSHDNAY